MFSKPSLITNDTWAKRRSRSTRGLTPCLPLPIVSWPLRPLKIKNTFIHMEVEDDGEESEPEFVGRRRADSEPSHFSPCVADNVVSRAEENASVPIASVAAASQSGLAGNLVVGDSLMAAAGWARQRYSEVLPDSVMRFTSEQLRGKLQKAPFVRWSATGTPLTGKTFVQENVEAPLTECGMCCTNPEVHQELPIFVMRGEGACSNPECEHWIIMRNFAWGADLRFRSGFTKCSTVMLFSDEDGFTWMMWLHGTGNPFFRLRTSDLMDSNPKARGIFLPADDEQSCRCGKKFCNKTFKQNSAKPCNWESCHFCHSETCMAELKGFSVARKLHNKR